MGLAVWGLRHFGGPAAWVCLGGVFLFGLAVFEILGHTFLIAGTILAVREWWPWSRRDGFVTNYGLMRWFGAFLIANGLAVLAICIDRQNWGGLFCPVLSLLLGLLYFHAGWGFSYVADAGRWLARRLRGRGSAPPKEGPEA